MRSHSRFDRAVTTFSLFAAGSYWGKLMAEEPFDIFWVEDLHYAWQLPACIILVVFGISRLREERWLPEEQA